MVMSLFARVRITTNAYCDARQMVPVFNFGKYLLMLLSET